MRAGKLSFIISARLFFILVTSGIALGQQRQHVNAFEGGPTDGDVRPTVQEQMEFRGSKDPVTIIFKEGQTLSAYLVRADAESIIIEVAGKSRRINLETVASIIQDARQFDRFGDVGFDDEKARLDNFAIALQNDPSKQGYIIVFGQQGRAAEAKKRADRAKGYLIESRGMDRQRLISWDHCVRDSLEFELWLSPAGVTPSVPCENNSAPTQTPSKNRRRRRRG